MLVLSAVYHAYKFRITCSSTLQEKYEKELKDARVRELMYAEREAILDKVLNSSFVLPMACNSVCLISVLHCFIFTNNLVEIIVMAFIPSCSHSFCSSSKCIFFRSPASVMDTCVQLFFFFSHLLCPQLAPTLST